MLRKERARGTRHKSVAGRQARIGRDQQSVLRVGVSVRRICDLKLLGKVTFYNTLWPSRSFGYGEEAK